MENKPLPVYMDDRLALDRFDEIWKGWTVRGPRLISPEGWTFTPSQVLTIPLMREQIRALQQELTEAHRRKANYSPRLTQWHTLQAAVQAVETEIRQRGTDDELDELRQLTQPDQKVRRGKEV